MRRRDGGFVGQVLAAEGARHCVLFAHVHGRERFETPDESRRYGAAVAAVHAASDDFRSRHDRFALDAEYLIEAPHRAVRPFLAHRPDDVGFFDALVRRLRAGLADLAGEGLDFGFCHGDLHGGNAHEDAGGALWFFDFDCCGPGLRAYDLAAFRWRQEWRGKDASASWEAFLDGYRTTRALREADGQATRLLVAVRELWLVGVHVQTAPDRGHGWNVLNDEYLDARLRFLRGWSAEHLETG